MNYLLVGYQVAPREEAVEILSRMPQPPSAKKKKEGEEDDAVKPADNLVYLNRLIDFQAVGVINGAVRHFAAGGEGTTDQAPKQAAKMLRDLHQECSTGYGVPAYKVIGFDPRLFLKLVGLDCSLPDINLAVPYRIWGAHSEYWDIESLLLASGQNSHKQFDLSAIVALYSAMSKGAVDKLFHNWQGPRKAAAQDLAIVQYFTERLGIQEDPVE